MANVRIEQRNGRLAADVRLETVTTREGDLAKATVVVISNAYRNGESEPVAVRWTVWGKQAENAARYLAKASRVNVVGSMKNNNYEKNGETVWSFNFTAEEIDYLDSREREARPDSGQAAPETAQAGPPPGSKARSRKAKAASSGSAGATSDDDIPF